MNIVNTQKPISSISYNSGEFLKQKIEYWKSCGLIEFGMWIKHKAEEDEKKDHYHVYIIPAKRIQTMDLENDSHEFDPDKPNNPKKCMRFQNSKEQDWIQYVLHDPEYMAEKGLEKKYCYGLDEIMSTDEDTLNIIISEIKDDIKGRLDNRIRQAVNNGMSWRQISLSGIVPMNQVNNARWLYMAITDQDRIK